MNWKRIFAFVASAGALAALVTSAATTNRRPMLPQDGNPTTQKIEASGAELDAEIARLRAHLHPTSSPSTPARNVFQFRAAPASARAAVAPPVAAPPAAAAPTPFAFSLIGVAETGDGASIQRTAILSRSGELLLVKVGDRAGEFRVVKIEERAIELQDDGSADPSAGSVRLVLR
ncbi:MAG TPA: hypothetical protein VJP86_07880 [Vicinamibacterales bacterium]|jgi:hypothetical protein|nr:hypothetical protein [Vicinamibacterales bacterium]